jgi:hypothetical protein
MLDVRQPITFMRSFERIVALPEISGTGAGRNGAAPIRPPAPAR